jgi:hypothetical protein
LNKEAKLSTNENDVNLSATSALADVNGADSSTTQTPETSTPQVTDVKNESDSSADNAKATKVEAPLDVVRSALKPEAAKPDASASGSETQATQTPKEGDGKLPELTPEEEAKLPFHKHPRWKEVIAERDTWRGKARELEEPAKQFQQVQDFMTKSNLQPTEVADGFMVMSLMRNNPAEALTHLKRYVSEIELLIGHKLPDDIQEKVEQGAITEDAGKELAKARIDAATSRSRLTQVTQQQESERSATALRSVQGAVEAWEQQAKSADPDFGRKKNLVTAAIKASLAGRTVTSPAEAVSIAKAAYELVNRDLKGFMPSQARTATPPTPRGGDVTAGVGSSAPPKTQLDAVKRALGNI